MRKLPRHEGASYDFALVGAGAAGLALAVGLVRAFREARVLLVDPGFGDMKNRTFGFWCEGEPLAGRAELRSAITRSWDRVRVVTPDASVERALERQRYHVIEGAAFRDACIDALAASGRAFLHLGEASSLEPVEGGVIVRGPGLEARAAWAFDSRPYEPVIDPLHVALTQRFLGWEIETETDAFDDGVVTLFDFRTEQVEGDVRFLYVLPFDRRRALVEHVALSERDAKDDLRVYVEDTLGLRDYRIARVEAGDSPLTDAPFPRRGGPRVLRVGIRGGRLKPSSGYAFVRMVEDSEAIVGSLRAHGHPFALPAEPRVFRVLDGLFLRVMDRRPRLMGEVFSRMFERNPADRVFGFLDERVGLNEILALGTSLPVGPFASEAMTALRERLGAALRRMVTPLPYEE